MQFWGSQARYFLKTISAMFVGICIVHVSVFLCVCHSSNSLTGVDPSECMLTDIGY